MSATALCRSRSSVCGDGSPISDRDTEGSRVLISSRYKGSISVPNRASVKYNLLLTTGERGTVHEPVSGLTLRLICSDGTSVRHDNSEGTIESNG